MVYQDTWNNGKCIMKGDRNCLKRYNLIKPIIDNKYHRPFTAIDIGANIGYFSIRLAEDFPLDLQKIFHYHV